MNSWSRLFPLQSSGADLGLIFLLGWHDNLQSLDIAAWSPLQPHVYALAAVL
jgi:hypothetical protein